MNKLPRHYSGKVNGPVLIQLAAAARYITCGVDLGDSNSYGVTSDISVDKADFQLAISDAGINDIFWVCWHGGPGRSLCVDPDMGKESSRTYPAEVWTDIKESPPTKDDVLKKGKPCPPSA